ncbi:MAG: hypothetical protein P1U88_00320 [Thalassobaculaceae bacterium]|nr:hypothetical protein [Thalassobaculaceae bacterium]
MDDAALRRQYDGLIERAGLRIPQDRDTTMFNAYRQVAAWTDIVRTRRSAAAEPSNAYALTTIARVADDSEGGTL